jgi:hypothetical protein
MSAWMSWLSPLKAAFLQANKQQQYIGSNGCVNSHKLLVVGCYACLSVVVEATTVVPQRQRSCRKQQHGRKRRT